MCSCAARARPAGRRIALSAPALRFLIGGRADRARAAGRRCAERARPRASWKRCTAGCSTLHLEKELKSVRVLREMRRPVSATAPGRPACCRMVTLQQLIFKLSEFWASRGCLLQQPLDIEMGAGTMHPETFLRVLGPEPLERRLRPAVAPAGRRPLRREPQPAVQAPPVPGHPQAGARRGAAALPAEPGGVRHRPARARRALRGRQLGVADARRVGHRLAGAVRRPGDHAVHLLPAGRRRRSRRRSPWS